MKKYDYDDVKEIIKTLPTIKKERVWAAGAISCPIHKKKNMKLDFATFKQGIDALVLSCEDCKVFRIIKIL